MINRIQRAAGALLIVAGVLILVGVGVTVVDPGGNDKSSTAISTTTSSTEAESSTTVAETPSTTAAVTTAPTTGETTSTTTSGSGLGTSGPGSAGETPIVNTGGPEFIGPLALALLIACALARRLRRTLA